MSLASGSASSAVFLDRDGIVNRAIVRDGRPFAPQRLDEVELVEEALEAFTLLKQSGFLLLVASNQPDVARGTQTRDVVDAIHRELARRLPIDDFFVCFHDDADACDCRKPAPGLLARGISRYGLDISTSFVVGDRWKDVKAGQAIGLRTVFVDYDYHEQKPLPAADVTVRSTMEAARWILQQ